jgi:hypothetical protein
MSLERIVRPFQAGDVFTARSFIPAVPPSGKTASEDVCVLAWSGTNPGDYVSVDSDQFLNGYNISELREDASKRVTETVRIEQDGNPDNYVDVERLVSTVMSDAHTGRTLNFRFAKWDQGRGG